MSNAFISEVRSLARKEPVRLGAVVLIATVFLIFADSERYLTRQLFYVPYLKARQSAGLAPELDNRVKMILVDDRSLQMLGRTPNFVEWQKIASLLFSGGFERVFLLGFPNLSSDLEGVRDNPAGTFVVAAASYSSGNNPRVIDIEKIESRLIVTTEKDIPTEDFPDAKYVMGPSLHLLPSIDALGAINIASGLSMPLGYRLSSRSLLPNIGLLAAPNLKWTGHRFESDIGSVPDPADRLLYLDFYDLRKSSENSVSAHAFFREGQVAEKMSDRLTERMSGGKIGVLVPEAYTGARYLTSALGNLPAYVATVSLINSTLSGHYIYKPMRDYIYLTLAAVVFFFILVIPKPKRALTGGTVAIAVQIVVSVGLLIGFGWLLPTMEASIIGVLGLSYRATRQLLTTLIERAKLSRDMEMGRTVQNLFRPKEFSGTLGDWDFRIMMKPEGPLSGDWVQVFKAPTESDVLGVVAFGDVVGKGSSAALVTAIIANVFIDFSQRWKILPVDIDEFVGALDMSIRNTFLGRQNTTLMLAVLTNDTVSLVCCGSPAWTQVDSNRASVSSIRMKPHNPLGAMANVQKKVPTVSVPGFPGTTLVGYTDGVSDSMVMAAKIRKDLARLPVDDGSGPSEEIFNAVEAIALESASGMMVRDDITLLVFRRRSSSNVRSNAA